MRSLVRIIAVALAFAVPASAAFAERVLRIEEVPVGELDPHKASDYIDSIINFNVYDSLVWPNPDGTFTGVDRGVMGRHRRWLELHLQLAGREVP